MFGERCNTAIFIAKLDFNPIFLSEPAVSLRLTRLNLPVRTARGTGTTHAFLAAKSTCWTSRPGGSPTSTRTTDTATQTPGHGPAGYPLSDRQKAKVRNFRESIRKP